MIELDTVRMRRLVLAMKEGRTSRVTLPPNNQPAPRGLMAQFSMTSRSDHMRSGIEDIHGRSDPRPAGTKHHKMHLHVESLALLIKLGFGLVFGYLAIVLHAHIVFHRL